MRVLNSVLPGLLLLLSFVATAQDFDVPANQPTSKDEFVKSEGDFIKAAKWLETTAIGTQTDKRKQMNAWVLLWITNAPTVTVELQQPIGKLFEKNPDLLLVFMAGYTRYCLENNYSKDGVELNTAGIKSAINCYNLGGDVRKDKTLSKVIDADKDGKLEDWVGKAIKG